MSDICGRRHRGNKFSQQANERVGPNKMCLRETIYTWLETNGSSTCEDISVALGLRYTTVSARLSELKALGRVEDTGKKRRTATRSWASVVGICKIREPEQLTLESVKQ